MTPADRARNVAALAIATHRISPARAQLIAADVVTHLERGGWGGRPDVIDLTWMELCAVCVEPTVGLRWDHRGKTYLPVCDAHMDAGGATGGAG